MSRQSAQLLKTIVLIGLAAMLWLNWGDLFPALSIFDGLEIGRIDLGVDENGNPEFRRITVFTVFMAILIGVVTFIAARNLPGFLEIFVLDRMGVDAGARYAIVTILGYIIVGTGIVLAFQRVGLQWSQLRWIVTGLSVGIGFGLQKIIANFVSGLILLFERPIRIGDYVTIGTQAGTVTRIKIRATTLMDLDNREILIPNENLISQEVTNWTLSNSTTRLVCNVGIAYGSDTDRAREVMLGVVKANPKVLDQPPPNVLFTNFGDSSLDFEVRVFLRAFEDRWPVKHAIHTDIYKALDEHGFEIPFPQRDPQFSRAGRADPGQAGRTAIRREKACQATRQAIRQNACRERLRSGPPAHRQPRGAGALAGGERPVARAGRRTAPCRDTGPSRLRAARLDPRGPRGRITTSCGAATGPTARRTFTGSPLPPPHRAGRAAGSSIFGHDACLLPMAIYPYWTRQFRRFEAKLATKWWMARLPDARGRQAILDRIARDGPLCSADFPAPTSRPKGMWERPPTKLALDWLWHVGALSTSHRVGFRKYYDLSERIVPQRLREAEASDAAQIDWLCRGALDRLVWGGAGDIKRFWEAVSTAEVRDWIARTEIADIEVEDADGTWRPALALPDIEARLARMRAPTTGLRLLNPFDPAIRDRTRLLRLFGFRYVNEIFKPRASREFGYYVYPVLEGDRMVARADLSGAKPGEPLPLTGVWVEDGVRWTRARDGRFRAELARLSRLAERPMPSVDAGADA